MRRGTLVGCLIAVAGCLGPLPADPAPDALARAADALDRGDEAGAVPHLREHVRAHPDAVMIRAHLAELLFRLGHADARAEFDRVVAAAQELTGPAHAHLVHCHTRLMALAELRGDGYHEALHRGIGLVLLVRRWDGDPDRRDEPAAERALGKAVAAIREALAERPGDPRASLYLADALDRLGQPAAAEAAARAARAGLPDPGVTPAERARIADRAAGR